MIKNIVFDMGQVFVDFAPRKFTDRYDLSEEDKTLLVDEIFEGNADWVLSDWGYLTEEDVGRRACEKLPERLHAVAMELATRWWDPIIPMEGTADIARRLKEAGYGLYLLSNAGYTHRTYWPTVPGSEYFDGVLASAYEKLLKPQPEIYRLLFERFGLDPSECLFTDDRATNLAGAEVCGMKTVMFKDSADFLKKLKTLGIEI